MVTGSNVHGYLLSCILIMVINMIVISSNYIQSYTAPGTYAVTIPSNYSVIVSLWGAGGSGSGSTVNSIIFFAGGSGAHVSCSVNVTSGSIIYLIVGQGGSPLAYGAATGNAIGGGGL